MRARGFFSDGSERFADFQLSRDVAGPQRDPSLSVAPDGSYAVAWEDDGDGDGNGTYQVWARSFRANGADWMTEWTVNRESSGQQLSPQLAVDEQGTVIVVWQDDMDGNNYQILANAWDNF